MLVKLVTPPVWNVPVELVSNQTYQTAQFGNEVAEHSNESPAASAELAEDDELFSRQENRALMVALWTNAKPWLGWIWVAGTLSIVCISLHRVTRFQRLLNRSTKRAPDDMQRVAAQLAQQLGRQSLPNIVTTSANISPLVWWVGGKVQIVVPQSIINELSPDQCQWVLAHELAHVSRRDYLVRWLEWLACAIYWWNPLVWWAQHNLRATEEICCDELVLSSFKPSAHTYANSILKTVESLVSPVVRPPAMVSEINSGGFLQRRIEMIMSSNNSQQTSRGLQFLVASLALIVMPFGMMHAQDLDPAQDKKDQIVDQNQEVADLKMQLVKIEMQLLHDQLKAAVEAGTMTKEEARRAWNEYSQQHNNGIDEGSDRQIEMEQSKRDVGLDIRKAVADGKMTPEEGRAALPMLIWKN